MPRIDRVPLERFTHKLLVAHNTPDDIAGEVADSLIKADLRGHSSHGVRQIVSRYASEIERGQIDPLAEPEIVSEAPTWALIDGNLSYGQLTGRRAVESAITRAKEHGVSFVGLKRSNHIGRVGEFAEYACAEGMAFASFVCNPSSAWVAPAGSSQRRLSTNPITLGVPSFGALDFPLIADIATSQVAHGKVKEYAAREEEMPDEWVVNRSGTSLNDPIKFEEMEEGALLPLGGHVAGYKGFSLAVMAELLSANISDGMVSGMEGAIWGNHAVFFVVDLESVTTAEEVANRADAMEKYIRSTDFSADISPGEAARGDETLVPGEAEHRATTHRLENGIPISSNDANALYDLAQGAGVDEKDIPDELVK